VSSIWPSAQERCRCHDPQQQELGKFNAVPKNRKYLRLVRLGTLQRAQTLRGYVETVRSLKGMCPKTNRLGHTSTYIRFLEARVWAPTRNECRCWSAQTKLIPSPHLLVLATSERFLPAWGTFRAILPSESHWLQPVLVLF
jgi:hypothetical protein